MCFPVTIGGTTSLAILMSLHLSLFPQRDPIKLTVAGAYALSLVLLSRRRFVILILLTLCTLTHMIYTDALMGDISRQRLLEHAILLIVNALSAIIMIETFKQGTHDVRNDEESLYERASFLSRYTFWWIVPVLRRAREVDHLEACDLPSVASSDSPRVLAENFRTWLAAQTQPITAFRLLVGTCFTIQSSVFLSSFFHGIVFLS